MTCTYYHDEQVLPQHSSGLALKTAQVSGFKYSTSLESRFFNVQSE
jgi:hypothetical protein